MKKQRAVLMSDEMWGRIAAAAQKELLSRGEWVRRVCTDALDSGEARAAAGKPASRPSHARRARPGPRSVQMPDGLSKVAQLRWLREHG